MARVAEELCRRGGLHDASGVHHVHVVTDFADDAEVVSDEDDAGPQLLLALFDQLKDLLLHGHIQGGGRFICDEDLWTGDEGHGDHHPLTHATGELMRVGLNPLLGVGDADLSEGLDGAGEGRLSLDSLMDLQGLRQLPGDREVGVEGGHGILEDHGDFLAADLAESRFIQGEEVLTLEEGPASVDTPRRPGNEAQERIAGDRLTRAGLPDNAEGLALFEGKGDVFDRVDGAVAGVEAGGEILNLQDRHERESRGGNEVCLWESPGAPGVVSPSSGTALLRLLLRAGAEGEGNGKSGNRVLLLDDIDEVVGEGLHGEVLIVDEENVLRNGDRLVAVIDGGGGVEKLEALLVAFVFRRRIPDEGVLQELIELSGIDDVVRGLSDFLNIAEDVLDGASFLGADTDEGGVGKEKELCPEVLRRLLEAGVFRELRFVQIPFIGDDEAGFIFLLDELRDFAVLGADSGVEIDHQEAEVRAANGAFGADGGEDLYAVIHAGALPEAGGVDQDVSFPLELIGNVHGITGGPGHVRNDGPLISKDRVNEGGFPGVWLPGDGDFQPFIHLCALGPGTGVQTGKVRVDLLYEVGDATSVLSGDCESTAEAEAGEVPGDEVLFIVVRLIDDEDHGRFGLSKFLGHHLIDGINPFPGVYHEEDEVGGVHGDASLKGHRVGEGVLLRSRDASSVDEFTGGLGQGGGSSDAVASHARAVMHDGDAPSGEAIKESGLADVGAADNGDLKGGSIHGAGRGGRGWGGAWEW